MKLLKGSQHICDIGAGYGGFARELSFSFPNLPVTAVEYRKDVATFGQWFANHIMLEVPEGSPNKMNLTFWDDPRASANDGLLFLPKGNCDAVVSLLCFLHIPKEALRDALRTGLPDGGILYAEDLVALDVALSDARFTEKVKQSIWMTNLTTRSDYAALLSGDFSGIGDSLTYDVSSAWKAFVLARWKEFRKLPTNTTFFCLRDSKMVR